MWHTRSIRRLCPDAIRILDLNIDQVDDVIVVTIEHTRYRSVFHMHHLYCTYCLLFCLPYTCTSSYVDGHLH